MRSGYLYKHKARVDLQRSGAFRLPSEDSKLLGKDTSTSLQLLLAISPREPAGGLLARGVRCRLSVGMCQEDVPRGPSKLWNRLLL